MKVAILGFGNIGQGVEELIYKNRKSIKNLTGSNLSVKKILIKDSKKKRKSFDKNIVFTDDFTEILEDEEIEAVIEVTGRTEEAYSYVSRAMEQKKSLITANKALVSKYFKKLYQLSVANDLGFFYEAAVGGGLHIIKSILEDLPMNEITDLKGILNGTCNFILTSMEKKGLSFNQALDLAQELGFAEADPSNDILGYDSKRKVHILGSLIFGRTFDENEIFVEGIETVKSFDIDLLKEKNFKLKLLAEGKRKKDSYQASVMPVAFGQESIFYSIENEMNLISYTGSNVGELFFGGKGAGRFPTAEAILRDLIDFLGNNYTVYSPLRNGDLELSNDDINGSFYLRLPKKSSFLLKDLGGQKYQNDDYQAVFTKSLSLAELKELIEKSHSKDYFFARIWEDS